MLMYFHNAPNDRANTGILGILLDCCGLRGINAPVMRSAEESALPEP